MSQEPPVSKFIAAASRGVQNATRNNASFELKLGEELLCGVRQVLYLCETKRKLLKFLCFAQLSFQLSVLA